MMSISIVCKDCQKEAPRTGPRQFYCADCSQKRDKLRNRKWIDAHPQSEEKRKEYKARGRSRVIQKGIETSKQVKSSIFWDTAPVILGWRHIISVPYSIALSKNHLYANDGRGHVYRRKESVDARTEITLLFKNAINKGTLKLVHNKVWIEILVQKSNHKSDAINVVDTICDGIKDAIPVDDRWFSIRKLDWEVVKDTPRVFIGIGQEEDAVDSQVCSYCGRILTFDNFRINNTSSLGIGRECKECLTTKK